MLGKLFKYEWRSISKLLLPIHGFVLLFALLSRFYFTISGGTDALLNTDSTIIGTLTMLLIFALVIVISSIAIFTYIYSGYHFHKNVFTDQGYLTNTLPVTPSQLLLSKELAALLWLLIDVVVISISIFILVLLVQGCGPGMPGPYIYNNRETAQSDCDETVKLTKNSEKPLTVCKTGI